MISYFQLILNLHKIFMSLGSRRDVLTGMFCYFFNQELFLLKKKVSYVIVYQGCKVGVCMCVQEGVGHPSSGDSGTVLRHAVCSNTRCFVPECICQARSHLVLLRLVLLFIKPEINISSGENKLLM